MASTFQPAGSPPAGIVPNFNEPTDTLWPEIAVTVTLSMVLTTVFTAARLVAKRAFSSFNIEDYFSIATWFLFVGYAITFLLQGIAGIGRHIWEIEAGNAPHISQISWAIELMYCWITWLAKVALLLQLQRTFAPTRSGAVYYACQGLIWSNLAFYGSSFLALVVECVPQQRIWDPLIASGHCIDTVALLIAMGIINVVSDLMILVMPIWAIFHLRMNMRLKLGISAMFGTGLLAVACSICRLVYTVPALHSEDSSYLFAKVGLWSLAEITSIITCSCFPLMPRFLQVVTGKHGAGSRISQQYRYKHYSVGRLNRATGTSNSNSDPAFPSNINNIALEDQERLYIHKTVSVKMQNHKR